MDTISQGGGGARKAERIIIFASVGLRALLVLAGCTSRNEEAMEGRGGSVITLELVSSCDPRLPEISEKDMGQVLAEARRIIRLKLGGEFEIRFHRGGTMSLDELFSDQSYRSTRFYKAIRRFKYEPVPGDRALAATGEELRTSAVTHLRRQMKLDELQGFFPGKTLNSYDQAFDLLMSTFRDKIAWLKTLKTATGKPLLVFPPPAWQSYVEWLGMMYMQERFDIIMTNSLIIYDLMNEPAPHTITKHAKVGGSSFTCPRRTALDGRCLMINILEEYGNVPGISRPGPEISRETRNKVLGGYLLAHEFGHAFYMIPDVTDHGSSCLMNTTLENMQAHEGYQSLVQDPSPCPRCRPWVRSKESIIKADAAAAAGRHQEAGNLYLDGIELLPSLTDGGRRPYVYRILMKAKRSFSNTNDPKDLKRLESAIQQNL